MSDFKPEIGNSFEKSTAHSETVPAQRVPPKEEAPKELTFGEAFDLIRPIISKVSKKDAQDLLKGLCAMHNLRVMSAFAPLAPAAQSVVVHKQTRSVPEPKVKNTKITKLRKEISQLNTEISKKSKVTGQRLPEEDPLISKRNQLFRDLKEAQNPGFGSDSVGVQSPQ
jgi:hypothetical protein